MRNQLVECGVAKNIIIDVGICSKNKISNAYFAQLLTVLRQSENELGRRDPHWMQDLQKSDS
jgi:hypothetical protein